MGGCGLSLPSLKFASYSANMLNTQDVNLLPLARGVQKWMETKIRDREEQESSSLASKQTASPEVVLKLSLSPSHQHHQIALRR